ncbi:MAG: hypothetical protein WKH64_12660 [Chloroflexia bacterium]
MRAAQLSSGGTDFNAWGGYKGMADNYNTDMNAATQIVQSLGLGDASFAKTEGGGGMSTNISHGAATFNINIRSDGNMAYDVRQIGNALRPAIERHYAEVTAKRGT